MEEFVKVLLQNIGGVDKENVAAGISWLDEDGDGKISRKEVGMAYNTAGRKFLEVSKTIKQMGPMLALFGGGDMGGMGNMKTEF